VRAHRLSPDVLKIDTEGTELQVLQGAAGILTTCRPITLKLPDKRQGCPFLLLGSAQNMSSPSSRCLKACRPRLLTAEQFREDGGANFAGLPREVIQSWPPGFGESRGPLGKGKARVQRAFWLDFEENEIASVNFAAYGSGLAVLK